MAYRIFGLVALTLVSGLARAHHPPDMERCSSFAFSGEIEQIQWRMPHVELVIRTPSGESHRVTWLSINQLALVDIDKDTLHIGDEITAVAGIQRDEIADKPMLLSYIHRNSDGWGWSQLPQGC